LHCLILISVTITVVLCVLGVTTASGLVFEYKMTNNRKTVVKSFGKKYKTLQRTLRWYGSDDECILDKDEICEIIKFLVAG